MKKIKRSIWGFVCGVRAEIRRWNDFVEEADERWRADPEAAEKRFDDAFSRWVLRFCGAFAIWAIVDVVSWKILS